MKRTITLATAWLFILALCGCVDEEEFADNSNGNFEALWRIMDQHYCFFSEKASTGTMSTAAMLPRWLAH